MQKKMTIRSCYAYERLQQLMYASCRRQLNASEMDERIILRGEWIAWLEWFAAFEDKIKTYNSLICLSPINSEQRDQIAALQEIFKNAPSKITNWYSMAQR